jgi:hypothetical protein
MKTLKLASIVVYIVITILILVKLPDILQLVFPSLTKMGLWIFHHLLLMVT